MTEAIWKIKKTLPVADGFATRFHPKIRSLLRSRGIATNEELRHFTEVKYELHDPFLMKDMEKAVGRLSQAIAKREKILVYGDYDVDGTTAIALVYSFLRDLRCDVQFYVPDRYKEGYGISKAGMDWAIEQKFQLMIALDCGIKANTNIAYAQANGIDVIVCDHHNEGERLPEAFAVLDPKRHDCDYPFKGLSGCGVGYKLLYAYCLRNGLSVKEHLNKYLDYVAISIAADLVPMLDENRVLMRYGMMKMQHTNAKGEKDKILLPVQIMLNHAGIGDKKHLTVSNVVFKIAPRINAAGRIDSARTAVNLLISDDPEESYEWCEKINAFNTERKNLDTDIANDALRKIKDEHLEEAKSTVLFDESWHKGVVGIVASRVIETYYRPTIILCGDGEIISGSARSVADFDLYSAIEKCSEYLTAFGGHTFAAGLSMKREDFPKFRDRFEEVVAARITESQQTPVVEIDAELEAKDITMDLLRQIMELSPFGPENMTPVFLVRHLRDCGSQFVGKDGNTVQFRFQNDEGKPLPRIVGFKMGEKWNDIKSNEFFDVCFTMTEDEFRGELTMNLEAKDVKVSGSYALGVWE